jgi:hypothetical protein
MVGLGFDDQNIGSLFDLHFLDIPPIFQERMWD